MSSLFVYHLSCPDVPHKVLNHFDDIAATLAEQGIAFARVQVAAPIVPGASEQDVVATFKTQIDTLDAGQAVLEVISVGNDHPQKAELRAGYLQERFHNADEVRFIVAGRGLFSLHLGDYVYALLCERNDVISVPAGTRHWFDLGENPYLVAIRLFSQAGGEIAKVTDDDIASRFAGLDD
ncbi:acireductone dioxygenase [Pseudomonas sp. 3A(2025)]